LAIGLNLRNPAALTNFLEQLYQPDSPDFHNFLTPEQFTTRFGPTAEDYEAVTAFARSHGLIVTGTHPNRMLLNVRGTAGDIEGAFNVMLNVYPHPTEAREFYAPDTEPAVDAALPILDVSGLSDYPRPRSMNLKKKTQQVGEPNSTGSANGAFLGNDFRAAYVPGTSLTGSNQVVGLLQFDGFYASDITAYETQAGLPNVPLQTVLLDGFSGTPTTGSQSGNSEVSLDIEMVISMAPGLSKIIVYEGSPSNFLPNDPLNRMASDNLAKQLSSSWGWSGGPNHTTDQIFQQFAAQGQSYFQASGDDDAYTGAQALDQASGTTTPMDSPYVTSVGGTTLQTSGAGGPYLSEAVWNRGNNVGSGGGISAYYSIPSWQTNLGLNASLASTTMRNIPDVAMTADDVYVKYGNGSSSTFGGTSCAAPLWAGFAALINQQAALGGKPPVGFINPALYALGRGPKYAATFHDITVGNNIGANTPGSYLAVAGYDLCTGWGTPTGTNLINALAPLLFVPVLASDVSSMVAESGTPANGAIDPGETVTLSFALRNNGAAPTTNLVALLQASGNILAPGPAQNYGVLPAFGGSGARTFTFTTAGACGATFLATLQLSDGAASLGTISFPLTLGSPVNAQPLAENFDAVTVPALPAGWSTAVLTGGAASWVTTSAAQDTSPNSAFCADSTSAGGNALVSPSVPILLTSAQLNFQHSYRFERSGSINYDGGFLEIKIGNGPFTDILSAGGSFVSGGYNGVITSGSDNPYPGRQAWVGNSTGWKSASVHLPPAAAGQTIQLRWVAATDNGNSVTVTGWYVDSVALNDASLICNSVTADVSARFAQAPASFSPGSNLIYTIMATNAGPQAAANVVLTDTLPANTVLVSASAGASYATGKVTLSAGMLAAGSSSNFTLVLAPIGSGPFTNNVVAVSPTPDPILSNNTAAVVAVQTVGQPPMITSLATNFLALPGSLIHLEPVVAGSALLGYQWFFNQTNLLASATNNSFVLPHFQRGEGGVYSVIVSNAYGSVTGLVATISVAEAPSILTQSGTLTLPIAGSGSLSLTATGTGPLGYQWFYNGTQTVAGVSGSVLNLTNVQPGAAGNYTVLITNVAGAITSAPIALRVLVPPVLDNSSLAFHDGIPSLMFQSVPGLLYTLEYSPTLAAPEWTPIPPSLSGTGGLMLLWDLDPPLASTNRYYRVRCE
jgi:uncharacterized repeat protein (TIGR01451 family)